MRPVDEKKNNNKRLFYENIKRKSIHKTVTKMYADLHAFWTNLFKRSGHACDKLEYFDEALISNTPRAINKEDEVCLGTFANCGIA